MIEELEKGIDNLYYKEEITVKPKDKDKNKEIVVPSGTHLFTQKLHVKKDATLIIEERLTIDGVLYS